jgi:hypothetical protein
MRFTAVLENMLVIGKHGETHFLIQNMLVTYVFIHPFIELSSLNKRLFPFNAGFCGQQTNVAISNGAFSFFLQPKTYLPNSHLHLANFLPAFTSDFIEIFSHIPLFENKVMKKIFGPKRDQVTGQWRKFNSG